MTFGGKRLGDLLNPMIVKELRQELRMRSFSFLFLAPQGFMTLAVFIQLADSGERRQTSELGSVIFWATIVIPLVILIPRRAFFSFTKETQANLLELVLLTKLSPWGVVFGKWAALAAESVLFVCSILPYVVLQYFLGDSNPIRTVEIIFLMLLASCGIIGIGLSGSASHRERKGGGFMAFLFFFFILWPVIGSIGMMASPRSSRLGHFISFDEYLVVLCLAPLGLLVMLNIGATKIAPPLENYALLKRFFCVLTIALSALLFLCGIRSKELLLSLMFAIVAPVCVSSLFEELHPVVVRTFLAKRRYLAFLTHPGWPGGIFFLIFCTFPTAILASQMNYLKHSDPITISIDLIGTLLVPYALLVLVFPQGQRSFTAYLIAHLVILIVSTVVIASHFLSATIGFGAVLSFFPMYTLIADLSGEISDMGVAHFITYFATGCSFLVLWREFRKVCQQNSIPLPAA